MLMLLIAVSPVGCTLNMNNLVMPNWGPKSCVLPPDATLSEIVTHLNGNISKLTSWRSNDVQIRVSGTMGMPSLSAMMAVESPRNFRLVIGSSLGGQEADFGSNSQQFWFWMRRAEPKYVYYARHDQIGRVQQRLQLPFQPDWLMEVFGVIPLDESKWSLESQTDGSSSVSLVSEPISAAGRPVKRILVVDTCSGQIVAHELRDIDNRVIAKAQLTSYQTDTATGIAVPRRIDLEWPQTGMSLSLRFGTIQVNPAPGAIAASTWQMQARPGFPPFDLASVNGQQFAPPGSPQFDSHGYEPAGYESTSRMPDHDTRAAPVQSQPATNAARYQQPSAEPPHRRSFKPVWPRWPTSGGRFFKRMWPFGKRRDDSAALLLRPTTSKSSVC